MPATAGSEASLSARQGAVLQRLEGRSQPIMIGVAGDSGSGKSTYTQGIEWLLGSDWVSQISLDGYHCEDRAQRRVSGRSPLDPHVNHLDQARAHLQALRAGQSVEVPIYDHKTGCFAAPRTQHPTPIILVEGLHTLYPAFLDLLDFGIYVDTDASIKHDWKRQRDVRERGYVDAEVEAEIARRQADYEQWIAHQQAQAQVILRIHPSELGRLALGRLAMDITETCHHLEVIVTPRGNDAQPALYFPVDLNNMTRDHAMPFMLATVPSRFQERSVNILHVDGYMPPAALETLEQEICAFIGLDQPAGAAQTMRERPNTVRFAQMLVAWPILGQIAALAD